MNNNNRRPEKGCCSKQTVTYLSLFFLWLAIITGIFMLTGPTMLKKQDENRTESIFEEEPIITERTYTVPCTKNGTPEGCDKSRVRTVECNSINYNGFPTVKFDDTISCAIEPVFHGQTLNVQFAKTSVPGECYEITAQVGECWGENPINGQVYSCQGQCGPGCKSAVCGLFDKSAWGRTCFRHDICSWYFGSTKGVFDANCWSSYLRAITDSIQCQLCDVENPTCDF